MTELEAAIRARNILSERSPAAVDVTIPHIQALIPTVLELWARELYYDPEKASLLESDYSIAPVAGIVDLTNYVNGSTAKISLPDLRSRTIYTTISGVRTPLTWVGSQAQLNYGRYPNDVPAVFLDGNKLRTRNTDGSLTSLATDLEFEAIGIPMSVATIPVPLEGDFIMALANAATKEKLIG